MTTAHIEATPNVISRGKWAKRIAEAWQKQLPYIFEVASLLESARAELRRGDWISMIKADLPFGRSMANKLMKIGSCDHLRNAEHVPHLPAHWGTLFELTLLTVEQFNHGITTGAINPKMQRKDVKALRGDGQKMPHEPRISRMAVLKRQLEDCNQKIAHLDEQRLRMQNIWKARYSIRRRTPQRILPPCSSAPSPRPDGTPSLTMSRLRSGRSGKGRALSQHRCGPHRERRQSQPHHRHRRHRSWHPAPS